MSYNNLNHENIVNLLVSIVAKYPDKIAVKDCICSLNYQELLEYARLVAMKLRSEGVKTNDRIVYLSKKNVEGIIIFWGILLSGGIPAFLERDEESYSIIQKINVIQPKLVILDEQYQRKSESFEEFKLVDSSKLLEYTNHHLIDLPTIQYSNTCYLLLTSGTTGIPKVVQVSHKNVIHYTNAIYKRLNYPKFVNSAHLTTFSADLGHTNTFLSLISGGMLRIFNKEEATDPSLFSKCIVADNISLLKATPSHLTSLISEYSSPTKFKISNIILGGEKLTWEVVKRLLALNICDNLYNHYGPTETTIGATTYKIDTSCIHFNQSSSVPIGSPLGDGICVLHKPKKNIGELYITGPGLCLGYLNNDEENKKRFVEQQIEGVKINWYITGDICKQHLDGNLEFLYRSDRQVKVRGYRIELGEIEVAMLLNSKIETVNLESYVNNEQTILTAYVKLKDHEEFLEEELREWMSLRLPSYKIPSEIYLYNNYVFNTNGKIDIKLLKKKFQNKKSNPINENIDLTDSKWETLSEEVWKSILLKDKIDDHEDFFKIGGDSIKSILLIGRLQRYGYNIHINDINTNNIFGNFKKLNLQKKLRSELLIYDYNNKNEYTFSQHLFFKKKYTNFDDYRQSIFFETNKYLDILKFGEALNIMLKRHPQLNKKFKIDSTSLGNTELIFKMAQGGLTILDNDSSKVMQIQQIVNETINKFSIKNGNLLYFHFFVNLTGKNFLYLSCHHLSIDVISWNILINELIEVYDDLINKKISNLISEMSITDFFNKLALRNNSKLLTNEAKVQYKEPIIRLPNLIDKEDINMSCCVYTIGVPKVLATVLKKDRLSNSAVDISGCLLKVFAEALLTVFKISKISIDIESHGRPFSEDMPDISNSISWWATTKTMNIQNKDLTDEYCSKLISDIYVHANKLNLLKNNSKIVQNDIADVRFNYLGSFPSTFKNKSIELTPSPINPGSTRSNEAHIEYHIYFTSRYVGDELFIDVQYREEKFLRSHIVKLTQLFLENLQNYKAFASIELKSNNFLRIENKMTTVGFPIVLINKLSEIDEFYNKKKKYLITGVTGFLGIHVFHDLIQNKNTIIYCLIRGNSVESIKSRLKKVYKHFFMTWPDSFENRVILIKGDIALDNFGLKKQSFLRIGKEIDSIIHIAADVNLTKNYSDLTAANIESTRQLIELAVKYKQIDIHYVSTLAVSGITKKLNPRVFSENDFDQGQDFISNYEKTKFEAERIVREFQINGGKAKIYRVGHIAADSFTGKFQINISQNRIFQIINGIILLGMAPKDLDEDVSFSNVDIVAKCISLVGIVDNLTPMNCLHFENPNYIKFELLVEVLIEIGYSIKIVSKDEFLKAGSNFNGTELQNRDISQMLYWVMRACEYSRNLKYEHHHSIDTLAEYGIQFPSFDSNWFKRVINEGIKVGYFKDYKLK